jgi:dihydroorotate dehydrogenase (fumarate)
MGIPLGSPFVLAASSISSDLEQIQIAERSGAGAIVIRSLFEEQILVEATKMEESLSTGGEAFAEALSYFPEVEHGGAKQHLAWIEKVRSSVSMPVFASLNAISASGWSDYAKQLQDTGIAGLELNTYSVAADPAKVGSKLEAELYDIVDTVMGQVSIPVSVKLSPFLTSVANVASQLTERNVKALVLFNRFLQPNIDPVNQALKSEMVLSTSNELKLPLRWVALLYGRIQTDLVLNTGVHSGMDAAKAFLAGAAAVQCASALIKNGTSYLATMLRELEGWMDEQGYESLGAFRGNLSQKIVPDPMVYERAQYVNLLMSS